MGRGHGGDKVKFTEGARNELDSLGLYGGARQRVEDWHKQQVAQQIAVYGAHSAKITHLAHARGSSDHKLHITIQQQAGMKHVYVNQRNMNKDYKNAVLSQYGSL